MQPSFSNLTSFLLASSLGLGFLTVLPEKTLAQSRQQLTALRRINQEEAIGAKPTIALVPGYGLNISFIPTGETIEKIWLDNPQYAIIDVDGCLEDLPLNRKCDRPGAQIVHLRRIRDIKFPGLYTTNSTSLTVVTNSDSRRNIYTFRLIKGAGNPTYNTVEIIPSPGYSNPDNFNLDNSSISYDTLTKGVQVALAQGLLKNRSNLWYRIDNFLLRLRTGTPLRTAVALSGVSEAVVLRLHNLGMGLINSTPVTSPSYPELQTPSYQTPAQRTQPFPVPAPVYQSPQPPTYPVLPIYQTRTSPLS